MTAERRTPDGTPTPTEPGTDTIERANTWSADAPGMRDVRHVHGDHDPRAWHWFARGPIVAADGGHRGDGRAHRDIEAEQLRDVSHEPAHGEPINAVWDRGDETVPGDEPPTDEAAE